MIAATALALTLTLTTTPTGEPLSAPTPDPTTTQTAPTTNTTDSPPNPTPAPDGPTSTEPPAATTPPTEPAPAATSPDVTVKGWWALPDGGTPDRVTWPQPVANPSALTCGTWYQVDTYPSQAALDGLAADGFLGLGEDYGVVISWRFVFGGDCPIVTPETPVIIPDLPDVPTGGDTTPDLPTPDTGIDVPVYVEAPAPVVPTPVVTAQAAAAPAPQAAVLASTGGTTNGWIPATGALLLGAALTIAARIRKARA